MAKTTEEKIAVKLVDAMDNVNFSPTLLANLLVNYNSLHTQEQLMKMIIQIIKQQSVRFESEWAAGQTSEALLLSNHLADVISIHNKLD